MASSSGVFVVDCSEGLYSLWLQYEVCRSHASRSIDPHDKPNPNCLRIMRELYWQNHAAKHFAACSYSGRRMHLYIRRKTLQLFPFAIKSRGHHDRIRVRLIGAGNSHPGQIVRGHIHHKRIMVFR